jgi:hypothetical protein
MRPFLLACGFTVTAAMGQQPPAPAQSAPAAQRVVLVELFTSEGCSSCPPADQLLRQIDGKRTAAGTLIVGISEHVTYWDHDGWKDPFSAEAVTQRQNEYGRRFNLESVYTPQMVVNGEAQLVGNDAKGVQQAIEKAHAADTNALRLGALKLDGDAVEATVAFSGALPAHGADLFAVVAEDETTEHVLSGENKGRTLAHSSVARTIHQVGKIHAAGDLALKLKLPAADAGTRRPLVVGAQEPNSGRVLGVGSQAF